MQSVISGSLVAATTALLALAPPAAEPPGAPLVANTSAAAPRCAPATLNASDVLPGTSLAVSPMPGTTVATPDTQISLLGLPAGDLSDVTATGSESGAHGGALVDYSQGDGASFVPHKPFVPGETVTVRGTLRTGSSTSEPFQYSFDVAYEDALPHAAPTPQPVGNASEVQRFQSRPDLRPPKVTVTTNNPGVAPGYVMTAPYEGPGEDGPMIFDNSGQLVWFDPLPEGTEATNLQVQQYRGQPVLTWWQGHIPPAGFGLGEEVIDNVDYRTIATVHAGNGLKADLHDFRLDGNNTALLTAFDPIHCNLSSIGGPTDGYVTNTVFQEIDLGTGLVRREWNSLDHVPLSDSKARELDVSAEFPYDYFHINTVSYEPDGNLLISARNTWALYVVDRLTGVILDTLGGKASSVTQGPGAAYGLPARRNRRARRHLHDLRQRRGTQGPPAVAGAGRAAQREHQDDERRTPVHALRPAALGGQPRQLPAPAQR